MIYQLKARHRKGRGIHSPFAYELVSKVLYDRSGKTGLIKMEEIVNDLKKSKDTVKVKEGGSGSLSFNSDERRISDLVKRSSVQPKFGRLLFNLVSHYKPENIYELGTSVGVSTLYLALANTLSKVKTVESDKQLCDFANDIFKDNNIKNVQVIKGIFDDVIPDLIKRYPSPDFVFIDGNHNYEATIRYYFIFCERIKKGLMVFDDIHWSREMNMAWKEIIKDENCQITFDLFFMGIVVVNPDVTPGHYIVRY